VKVSDELLDFWGDRLDDACDFASRKPLHRPEQKRDAKRTCSLQLGVTARELQSLQIERTLHWRCGLLRRLPRTKSSIKRGEVGFLTEQSLNQIARQID
jgi:hypothetical protein